MRVLEMDWTRCVQNTYRYWVGPYRKHRGHMKRSAGAQDAGVAAVVSIRRDEGSLFGFGTKLLCVLNQLWPDMRRRDRTSEG